VGSAHVPEAHAFLKAVWDHGPLSDARLNDQAVVSKLLGFSYLPQSPRPLHPSSWLSNTGWLDQQWNMLAVHQPYATAVARGVHFGGMDLERKHALISQQIINDRLPGWRDLLPADAVDAIDALEGLSHA
jgi:hypothetical protein